MGLMFGNPPPPPPRQDPPQSEVLEELVMVIVNALDVILQYSVERRRDGEVDVTPEEVDVGGCNHSGQEPQ